MPSAPTAIRPSVSASPSTAPSGVALRPNNPAAPIAVADSTIAAIPSRRFVRGGDFGAGEEGRTVPRDSVGAISARCSSSA